jgi:predicted small secreted protein
LRLVKDVKRWVVLFVMLLVMQIGVMRVVMRVMAKGGGRTTLGQVIGEKIVVWVGKVLLRTRRRVQRVMVEMVRATREERMRIMGSVMVMRTRGVLMVKKERMLEVAMKVWMRGWTKRRMVRLECTGGWFVP